MSLPQVLHLARRPLSYVAFTFPSAGFWLRFLTLGYPPRRTAHHLMGFIAVFLCGVVLLVPMLALAAEPPDAAQLAAILAKLDKIVESAARIEKAFTELPKSAGKEQVNRIQNEYQDFRKQVTMTLSAIPTKVTNEAVRQRVEGLSRVVANLDRLAKAAAMSVTTNPCDVNGDGVVDAADVDIAKNLSVGIPQPGITFAGLTGSGVVTVVDVQRVINVVRGGKCLVGP